MTTPTPEQLQERKEWIAARTGVHVDLINDADCENFEAYAYHKMMKVEDVEVPKLKSHTSQLGGTGDYQTEYWLDVGNGLPSLYLSSEDEDDAEAVNEAIAKPYRKVAALQEYCMMMKDQFEGCHQQFTEVQHNLGITEIELSHRNTLLKSCENALTEANAEIERLKGIVEAYEQGLIKSHP